MLKERSCAGDGVEVGVGGGGRGKGPGCRWHAG